MRTIWFLLRRTQKYGIATSRNRILNGWFGINSHGFPLNFFFLAHQSSWFFRYVPFKKEQEMGKAVINRRDSENWKIELNDYSLPISYFRTWKFYRSKMNKVSYYSAYHFDKIWSTFFKFQRAAESVGNALIASGGSLPA